MTTVLDAGALIAAERRDRRVGAMLRVLQRDQVPIRTSAGVVAQVWRDGDGRSALLARLLAGVDVVAIDDATARRVGGLLGSSGMTDLVDAHVALLVEPGGRVLTSDAGDVARLLSTRGVKAEIVSV